MSKFEALLLENVRIPQSEIELKQIEAGWAAGDRITACSTPRWRGGWWLVAGGWYVNNRSVVDTFHYKVDNCHDYVVCTVHTPCPPTPAHSQRGLYRAGVIGKIFLCQLG